MRTFYQTMRLAFLTATLVIAIARSGTAQAVILPDQCDCDTSFLIMDTLLVIGNDTIDLRGPVDSLETLTVLGLAADDVLYYIDENRDSNLVFLQDSVFMDHDWYEVSSINQPDSIADQIYTFNNVGIGAASPAGILHVNSDDDRDALFTKFSDDVSNEMDVDIIRGLGSINSQTVIDQPDIPIGAFRFRTYISQPAAIINPLEAYAPSASVAAETDGIVSQFASPGKLIFGTTPNGQRTTVDRMVIRQDGTIGINEDDPSHRLHVVDASDPVRIEGLRSSTSDSILVIDGQGVLKFRSVGTLPMAPAPPLSPRQLREQQAIHSRWSTSPASLRSSKNRKSRILDLIHLNGALVRQVNEIQELYTEQKEATDALLKENSELRTMVDEQTLLLNKLLQRIEKLERGA